MPRSLRIDLPGRARAFAVGLVLGLTGIPGLTGNLAHARVEEQLNWVEYPVTANSGESLSNAINRASKLRHNDRIVHGYTDWWIDWRLRWNTDAQGLCRITERTVKLRTTITMPRLDSAPATLKDRFASYQRDLRTHELGHHELARQAANEIDQRIARIPGMRNCADLEAAANREGQAVLMKCNRQGVEYDRKTDHGRTQGAYLTNSPPGKLCDTTGGQ